MQGEIHIDVTIGISNGELLLVYEFIPNGTVIDHIHGHQATPGSLTWPTRMSIAIETASALEMKYFFFLVVRGSVVLKDVVYYYYYFFGTQSTLSKKKLSRRIILNYVVRYYCNIPNCANFVL